MWSLEHTQVPSDRKLKRGVEVTSQDKPDSVSDVKDNKGDNKDESIDIFKPITSFPQAEEENG